MSEHKKAILLIAILAGIAAIVLIVLCVFGGNGNGVELDRKEIGAIDETLITMACDTDSFSLHTPTGDYEYEYNDIEEIVYMSNWTFDDLISGKEDTYTISGTMVTEDNEEYDCHAYKSVNRFISLYIDGRTLVFNLHSNDATYTAYEDLKSSMFGS